MSSNPYPSIPDPGQTIATLTATVAALRQAVQLLVAAARAPVAETPVVPSFTQATTAPLSPNIKDLWYNPTTGHLSMWINLGTSNGWFVI